MESTIYWLLLMFFLRIVRVQTMKTKYAKDTLQAFKKIISQKNTPEKLWVGKETEYGRIFKNFCKEKNNEIYSTMSETKLHLQREPINH